jgi:hypothetical protein
MQRKSSCWLFVPGGLFVCTLPVFIFTKTYPESPVPAEQLVVFGQVSDADGIVDNEEDFDHNGAEL